MIVAIFALMLLALVAARWAPRWIAIFALAACFALALGEFLWEVYSPDYGFRLPWLQATIAGGRPA